MKLFYCDFSTLVAALEELEERDTVFLIADIKQIHKTSNETAKKLNRRFAVRSRNPVDDENIAVIRWPGEYKYIRIDGDVA